MAMDSHSYLFKGFNYIEPNIIRSMSTLDMGALFSTIIASVFLCLVSGCYSAAM